MSHGKVRGTSWCSNCKKEQVSFLTNIMCYDDRKEVLGICSVCSLPVKRVLQDVGFSEAVEKRDPPEKKEKQEEISPPPQRKNNRQSKVLPILLTLAGLLLIVLTFNHS